LLGSLTSLLNCPSSNVLGLAGYLLGLIGDLARGILHPACHLTYLIREAAQGAALLLATGEPAEPVLYTLDGLTGLVGCLTDRLLGLAGYLLGLIGDLPCYLLSLIGRLACYLLGLVCGLAGRGLGLLGGPILLSLHRLGRLYHVADDDTPVASRALYLSEVHAALPRLAAGRVRGLDLALAPDLVRVQLGDVLLRFVDTLLDGGVVVHQFLKQCLEGLFASARDLIWQTLERGAIVFYLLLESVRRLAEVVLGQAHSLLLDLPPGLLDALVQPL
jgi:hypothetical protein